MYLTNVVFFFCGEYQLPILHEMYISLFQHFISGEKSENNLYSTLITVLLI